MQSKGVDNKGAREIFCIIITDYFETNIMIAAPTYYDVLTRKLSTECHEGNPLVSEGNYPGQVWQKIGRMAFSPLDWSLNFAGVLAFANDLFGQVLHVNFGGG